MKFFSTSISRTDSKKTVLNVYKYIRTVKGDFVFAGGSTKTRPKARDIQEMTSHCLLYYRQNNTGKWQVIV